MIGIQPFFTGIAIVDVAAHDLSAAEFDVLHRLYVAGEHAVAVLRPIGRAVCVEDIRQFQAFCLLKALAGLRNRSPATL